MDVGISVVTGGGKKGNRRTHGIVLKDVVTLNQVKEALDEEFKQFFTPQLTLEGKEEKVARKKA